MSKTAVLIHGCHLQAKGWEEIVWGDPLNDRLGRVPFGLLKARECNAKMIIFSTGASERDGLKEGAYTLQYTLQHLTDLTTLLLGKDIEEWLEGRVRLELTSQNTREEILASARLAHAAGMKRLILVSSPEHIMRCHQAALSVLSAAAELKHFLRGLSAAAADTHFADASVDDVVIIEPPHRGDTPSVPFHKTIKPIFQTLRNPDVAFELNDKLKEIIDSYVPKV